MRLQVKMHMKNLVNYLANRKSSINSSYTNDNFEKYISMVNVCCECLRGGYIRLDVFLKFI